MLVLFLILCLLLSTVYYYPNVRLESTQKIGEYRWKVLRHPQQLIVQLQLRNIDLHLPGFLPQTLKYVPYQDFVGLTLFILVLEDLAPLFQCFYPQMQSIDLLVPLFNQPFDN